jgi:ribosomal protein S18 acetylase RimI-like enzyme
MSSAWGFEQGALWALELPEGGGGADQRPGVRIGPVGGAETGHLAAAMGLAEAEVLGRLARGCRVIAAWQGDEVASYCWISAHREHVGELARDLSLPAGESYVWDCATVPRYRGQGFYRSLLRKIAETLSGEGQRRVWIGASTTNEASNRTFGTVGFRPAASIVSVRLAGRGVIVRLQGAEGADPTLVAAARYALTGRE